MITASRVSIPYASNQNSISIQIFFRIRIFFESEV
jgi:hypothetical protein